VAWSIAYAPPSVNTGITPAVIALALSGSPPTVAGQTTSIQPGTLPVGFVGQAPNVSNSGNSSASLTPNVGSLTLLGQFSNLGYQIFDYFIAPNGDDNNNGLTPSTAWSITALKSKQSVYGGLGKKIGIIGDVGGVQTPITFGTVGGVQTTLVALANAAGTDTVPIKIDGGTSTNPTYIASCNSAGIYTPRWAIIDFGTPNHEVYSLGQNSELDTQVPHPGNCTIDGITVRNFTYGAICFNNPGGSVLQNCVVKNCEIYNGGGVTSSNNPTAIRFWNVNAPVVNNCKVHDLQTIAGASDPQWGFSAAGIVYGTTGVAVGALFDHNTFYNCTSVLTKDTNQDFASFSYNYCDSGIFGSAPFGDLNAGIPAGQCPASGVTSVIHHNIMLRGLGAHAQDSFTCSGTIKYYNNTVYGANSGGAGLAGIYMGAQAASGASIQFFNNIVYSTNGYNAGTSSASISVDLNQGWSINGATFNNNVYGNGITFGVQNDVTLASFAAWKTATGCDANSVVLGAGISPFSGTPTAQTPSTFATNSNAVIGAITCGALDGSGTVGCNF
jgi:hypothetical protein